MTDTPDTDPKPARLLSLDAMRGLVIALMLLVNMTWDREALPAQLFHVSWNDPAQGATVTDLVFPWFVFIAGAAIPLSIAGGRGRGKSGWSIAATALRRGATLYLLGVLLAVASFAHERPVTWECLFSWNILQLIGAAYFVAVVAWLAPWPWRVAFVLAALALKQATLMLPWDFVTQFATPRPPEGAPSGPGTWAHFDAVKQLLHMEFVPIATLRSHLIGWFGMAQQFVPLAAIAVVGGLVTEPLADRAKRGERGPAWGVLGAGLGLIALSVVLQWGYRPEGGGLWGTATVPYSKWLFSPAYCLLAAGSGAVLLWLVYLLIDVLRWTTLPALRSMGKNALAIYFGAEMAFKLVASKWLLPTPDGASASVAAATQAWIGHLTGSASAASLGWALLWTLLWLAIAVRLDRRGLYWRV